MFASHQGRTIYSYCYLETRFCVDYRWSLWYSRRHTSVTCSGMIEETGEILDQSSSQREFQNSSENDVSKKSPLVYTQS